MSKSKCPLCGKVLKGGEWRFYKDPNGKVLKVCVDGRFCNNRAALKGERK